MRNPRLFALLFFSLASAGLSQQSTPKSTAPLPASPYGQTIFSRSAPDATTIAPTASSAGASSATTPPAPALATDAERTALTFTAYALEVHLDPARHAISVRARLVARNDSTQPLHRLALQLSSQLHWETLQVDGKSAPMQTEALESDIDHTGKLTEAVVSLPAALAPGATVHLDAIYSGSILLSSERLLRLGAPEKIADSSEWDRIDPGFTALRGFGNVIWFPVSTAPVLLGEGPKMFDSVGKWKLRESDAQVSMRVLVQYTGSGPDVAFLNGFVVRPDAAPAKSSAAAASVSPSVPTPNNVPRIASFTLAPVRLGFSPLSFFVMTSSIQRFPGLEVYTRHGDEQNASAYETLAQENLPLVRQWLGDHPRRPVVLVGLPDSGDLPFEDRNVLWLPLQANPSADTVGPVLAHMWSHAYFVSSRPWLDEGVAQWMTLLWIEQRAGRATAIAQMDSTRGALALAETSDPGIDPGQSLINAWSDIYYRDKASDVLWMLRDIAGDTAMAKALQSYDPARDHEPSYFQALLQKASGKDLEWFFDDWVYRDRGLPDLHIVSAYRRPILTKNSAIRNYLVSVDVRNDSFCAAEVPVTVDSTLTTQTKRLFIPSHARAALRILLDSEPVNVTVNDGSVPEVRTSRHRLPISPAQ